MASKMRQIHLPPSNVIRRLLTTPTSRPNAILIYRVPSLSSLSRRCNSTSNSAASNAARLAEEQLKRAAQEKLRSGKGSEIAEKLLIYHAGTGKTTFMSMFKVTTLFVTAFFCFIAVPAYVKADKAPQETALVALGGIVPLLFIAYTTSPFVTHMHIHLPAQARASRAALERFVRAMPQDTKLTITTMSLIGKPRYSSVAAGDLKPVSQRFGIINYVRDTTKENESRKWYHFRAVSGFHIPPQRNLPNLAGRGVSSGVQQSVKLQAKTRGSTTSPAPAKKKDLLEAWIWDTIKEKLQQRSTANVA